MVNKNITSPTAARIFSAWEKEGRSERQRTYLGASLIGHECDRYLWYLFRGAICEKFDGRMYRLFNRGHREEAVFCEDLRKIGCEVKEKDEETGQQFAVSALGGHFAGHLDAIARGFLEAPKTWHVCEFKTHSDASFKKLCKDGVKLAKPMHFAQMQCYMGLTGLKRAFYLAVNKDNDDLWCERIEADSLVFNKIMDRAKHIIDTCEPERCASRPDDFRCKGCVCHSICWHTANEIVDSSIPLLCRTCCHATALTDGEGARWSCRLGKPCGSKLTCDKYLVLPIFVDGEIVEGCPDSITFDKDNKRFIIGTGGLSCSEAQKIGVSELDGLNSLKEVFPEAMVASANTLELKYSDRNKYEVDYDDSLDGLVAFVNQSVYFKNIIVWGRPIRREEAGGKMYLEYPNVLVIVDKNNNKAQVISEMPPF